MPYFLELGSDGHPYPEGKAIVVNAQTGRHASLHPLPMARAKAQKRVLEAAEGKEKPVRKSKGKVKNEA